MRAPIVNLGSNAADLERAADAEPPDDTIIRARAAAVAAKHGAPLLGPGTIADRDDSAGESG